MTDYSLDRVPDLAPSARYKFATRVLPLLLLALILLSIPLFEPSRTWLSLFNAIGINMVFALSYNMLLGQAGMLSFGHAVYFGLGGYAAMHGMNAIENASYDGGLWAAFPMFALPLVGFAGGALAGAVIGWPSCRRAGVPFAMISLGIAELVAAAGFMFISVFGGEEGITGDRMNGVELFGLSLGPLGEVYWFIAFWTFLGVALMYAFTRTPLGKLAQAVRDNPERVQFVGYNPNRVRYLVFIAAGGFAGLAGGMSAVNYEIFTPESLSAVPSGLVLLMAFIGGARYFAGPILGAVVLTYMQSNLSDYSEAWLLYLGLLFIGMILFAPGGLAGLLLSGTAALKHSLSGQGVLRAGVFATSALMAAAGVIVLVELAVRHSNGFGEAFEPFGFHLAPDQMMPWVVGLILAGVGMGSLKVLSRQGGVGS
ncbi:MULTISPECIES: branched-chain amino acid ABC transporter permease [unclassified Pseudovibrio]|uniref:branched-chain amino acid ABC transporter permease n=1 Tax=unclassified Pseudovibrio TaxID=2627060 RepID=UPI0007AEB9F1|nr:MULTISPECIES: branched-chain amino acid ABC transporter permease [unclassified Pseudovibrio]KZL00561.1 leucine/isoleucine/valine transporter permease subunit [Pseudovibrio sp. W74]KZL07736.1 leucine/isoleucine/valine transporter permease subunit [Pseudovibrio sp. Ad14]